MKYKQQVDTYVYFKDMYDEKTGCVSPLTPLELFANGFGMMGYWHIYLDDGTEIIASDFRDRADEFTPDKENKSAASYLFKELNWETSTDRKIKKIDIRYDFYAGDGGVFTGCVEYLDGDKAKLEDLEI